MARGWESKSVEAQIETATGAARAVPKRALNDEQRASLRKKESLLLSRTRVLNDLKASRNPKHRNLLEIALKDLEQKLAELEQ